MSDPIDPSAVLREIHAAEDPREWEDLSWPPLPEDPPDVVGRKEEAKRQADLRDDADRLRQERLAQETAGAAMAEDADREVAALLRQSAVNVLLPSANLDTDDRPHFLRTDDQGVETCGQDGEPWPCTPWREHIGPNMETLSTPELVADAAEEARQRQAAALLGVSRSELDTMLQRLDPSGR